MIDLHWKNIKVCFESESLNIHTVYKLLSFLYCLRNDALFYLQIIVWSDCIFVYYLLPNEVEINEYEYEMTDYKNECKNNLKSWRCILFNVLCWAFLYLIFIVIPQTPITRKPIYGIILIMCRSSWITCCFASTHKIL